MCSEEFDENNKENNSNILSIFRIINNLIIYYRIKNYHFKIFWKAGIQEWWKIMMNIDKISL